MVHSLEIVPSLLPHRQSCDDLEIKVESADGSAADHSPPTGATFFKQIHATPKTTIPEIMAAIIGSTAILTSLWAALVLQSFLVLVASVISSVSGVYLFWQQKQWTAMQALEEVCAALSSHLHTLQQSNLSLNVECDKLQRSLQTLVDLEQTAAFLNCTEGFAVEQFSQQIRTHKCVLKSLESNVHAVVLQNLLSVILCSDANSDMIISEEELDDMVQGISQIPGIAFDEERLRKTFLNQSVGAIMELVREFLLHDDTVFRLETIPDKSLQSNLLRTV